MKEKYDVDKLLHIGLSAIFIVVFCPDHKYSEAFGTYCQTIWLMILFSLPGLCLYKKECFCINHTISTKNVIIRITNCISAVGIYSNTTSTITIHVN